MASSETQKTLRRPQNKSQKRQEAGDCRWSRKDESLRETSEFLELIGQSEFRLVPEELEAFLDTLNSEGNITR